MFNQSYIPTDDDEYVHLAVMKNIISSLKELPLIFKGGSSLLFGYKLDRFSEDLDFDSSKKISLESTIEQCFKKGIFDHNNNLIKLQNINITKDTQTVTRYRINYLNTNNSNAKLKIEISHRDKGLNKEAIRLYSNKIDDINFYKLPFIIESKLACIGATNNEGRGQIRDLYDLEFLSRVYPLCFTINQSKALFQKASNPDLLYSAFKESYELDKALNKQEHPLDDIVLNLYINAEKLCLINNKKQFLNDKNYLILTTIEPVYHKCLNLDPKAIYNEQHDLFLIKKDAQILELLDHSKFKLYENLTKYMNKIPMNELSLNNHIKTHSHSR